MEVAVAPKEVIQVAVAPKVVMKAPVAPQLAFLPREEEKIQNQN